MSSDSFAATQIAPARDERRARPLAHSSSAISRTLRHSAASDELLLLAQPEAIMKRAHRELRVLLMHDAAHLDLARRDRLDVDPFVREDLEHLRRDAGVRAHAEADDRHLHDVFVVAYVGASNAIRDLFD